MLKIEVTGLDALRKELQGFSERRLQAAAATALTRTARDIARTWTEQLGSRFDRPTGATVNAVRVTQATAANLTAEVRIRADGAGTPPAQWLGVQEFGGARQAKKFELALQAQGAMPSGWRAVPGPAAKLDEFGNVARAQIVQVIAQLGAKFSPGYKRVISAAAAKRAKRALATGRAYVAITDLKGKLKPGVYERRDRGLEAVFYFVPAAQYRRLLDLTGEARRVAAAQLGPQVQRAIAESAGRLAAKGR